MDPAKIEMIPITENVWFLRYPLSLLGAQIGRTVTILRLASKEVVVHSTAPFGPEDVLAIEALGNPVTLVDATLFHDTCARHGRDCFPRSRYFAPKGFGVGRNWSTKPLMSPDPDWKGELECLLLRGMPKVREHVFFHTPSRTLIVADLIFNFDAGTTPWTRFVFRHVAGIKSFPGMSRMFRFMIRDQPAFRDSLHQMMEWDFDRVIVGHGGIIEQNGKDRLGRALSLYL